LLTGYTLIEQEDTLSVTNPVLNDDLSEAAEIQEKRAKNAKAKELLRVAYEAKTTARKCLGCGDEFRSEGAHHRMCNRCRSRR
jgi:hypothetical protein